MADDSEHIQEEFKFHPCDTPRGMMYYKLTELTDDQQNKLNRHKINVIRENQIYLGEHPEVRVVIKILLRAILRARPKATLQEFLSKYFSTAWPEIRKEIDKAIAEKRMKAALMKGPVSGISLVRTLTDTESADEELQEATPKDAFAGSMQRPTKMCRSILNEIINDLLSDHSVSTDLWPSTAALSDQKATPFPSEVTLYDQIKEETEEYTGE